MTTAAAEQAALGSGSAKGAVKNLAALAGPAAAEAAFVGALDATQDYLALREQLAAGLKTGLLALARARYSASSSGMGGMGLHGLGAAQYPAAMAATARVQVVAGEAEAGSGAAAFRLVSVAPGTAASTSGRGGGVGDGSDDGGDGDDDDAYDSEEELAELLEEARRLAQGTAGPSGAGPGDDKAGGGGGAGADGDARSARRRRQARKQAGGGGSTSREPLHWFGALAPPALREAQASFKEVLATCVQLASKAADVRSKVAEAERLRAA